MKTREERMKFAVEMRQNPTTEELLLHKELKWLKKYTKNSDKGKLQYTCQALKGHYILDFYFPKSKLAVEIDGESHDTVKQKEYDQKRTERLNKFGIKVIRFTNEEVKKNAVVASDKVCKEVLARFKPKYKSKKKKKKEKEKHYTRMTPGRGPVVIQR